MTRAGAIVLGSLAMGVVAMGLPPAGIASELCRVRSKALVVRDVCKPREETLGAAEKAALGMGGPRGPQGSHGSASGDLRVLDADGDEVGVVTSTQSYYGSATAVGRLTLPGKPGPEFVMADVDGLGLSPGSSCTVLAQAYRASNCEGEALVQCSGDACGQGDDIFARVIFRQDATTACYLGAPSEAETGTFFRRFRVLGTPAQIAQQCAAGNGTLVGPVVPCRPGVPFFFCGQCCRAITNVSAVPLHYFDASIVGSPPFRLSR